MYIVETFSILNVHLNIIEYIFIYINCEKKNFKKYVLVRLPFPKNSEAIIKKWPYRKNIADVFAKFLKNTRNEFNF